MSNLGSNGLRDFETDMVPNEEHLDKTIKDAGLTLDVWDSVLPNLDDTSNWFDSTDLFWLSHPGNRQATSNHKGVHQRKVNGKWAARLCVDSRKVDLGEYITEYAASRAYQVGAFYYNKPLDTTFQSFVDSLPCVPDNLSDGEKRRWVRERARHYALTVNGKSTSKSVLAGSSSLEARPSTSDSYGSKSVLAGSSSLESRPSTPNSYGAHASCGNYSSPTTSGSVSELLRVALEEEIRFKRQKCVQTTLPDVELQQERNQTAHQALPHITNSTDSILFALCELRKQGWNYKLKSQSPSSVKAGVLFSLPQGQQTGPPLLMTDIIISSFYELREQGWEVHLEPSKRDEPCSSGAEREERQVADRASLHPHPPITMVHPTFHEVRRGGRSARRMRSLAGVRGGRIPGVLSSYLQENNDYAKFQRINTWYYEKWNIKHINPLVPMVVLEKPQFLGQCFFKTFFVEIKDTINSLQPYKCKYSLMKQVSVKSW